MADFYALLRFFEAKDSASPGWLQPISLRETLLFEKWSSTLRVCLMADFYAHSSRSGVSFPVKRKLCSGSLTLPQSSISPILESSGSPLRN